jgi:Fe2+ transport system protein FeoA
MQLLSQLKLGQHAIISAIEADETLFHRLSALGFRVGKPLSLFDAPTLMVRFMCVWVRRMIFCVTPKRHAFALTLFKIFNS